jgi:HK97 family phage major capsid protein
VKRIDIKLLRSLQQRKADLLKDSGKLIEIEKTRALNEAENARYKANVEEMQVLNKSIGDYEQQRNDQIEASGILVEEDEADRKPKFKSLGEQLTAIVSYEKSRGANRDPRLISVGSAQHLRMVAAAGMNETVPSDGGFLVQTDVAQDLLQRTYDSGEILGLCQNITVSSSSNRMSINGIDETSRANGSRFGGVQAFWTNEAQTVTATKPKFRRVELVLNKLMAVSYATDEMVADATVMDSVINTAFPLEFNFRIEDACINGLGNGQPLGILNHPALVIVAKEAAQAAGTLVAQNIMKMWSRMWSRSRKNAVWLIDQSIEPQLFQMQLPTAAGISVPIYLPPGGLSASPYGTLFGRPVIPTEYNASLTSLGDIILADFSQYVVARKSVLQAASSMHVNFLTDEQAFRFTLRLDGQPTWNAALTPKNGGPTLSPFVTLQAR